MLDEGFRVENADNDNSDSLKEKFQFYVKQTKIQILILFVATIIVYANSLNVPFYLDDYHSIVENPIIHDMSTMMDKRDFQIMRLTGTFSLATNYSLHQTSVMGYHLVNLAIHFLAGLAVFFLLRGLIQAQQYTSPDNNTHNQHSDFYLLYLPLISALIFLLHPLQTQAVTYIVQRHASLAALFYIASMATFVYARLTKQHLLYLITAIFAVLALFSKENTVTLPVSLLLIEVLFFQNFSIKQLDIKKLLLWSASAILISIILALSMHYFMGVSFELIDRYTHTADVKHIARLEYFSTQMLVIWHYIKLFIIPLGLHLDYDIALQKSFFSFSVLVSLMGHLVILVGTALLARQRPIILFAVFFYYIAHAVESAIIPILDLAFEHRTYLPNLGLSIIAASFLTSILNKNSIDKKSAIPYPLIIIVTLSMLAFLTIQRNNQWANPVQFYQNETQLSPNKERVWSELGKVYLKEKNYTEALKAFGTALNLGRNGNTVEALPTTFLNTYFALLYAGQIQKAIDFESMIPIDSLSRHDRSVFHYMQANRQVKTKEYNKAIQGYQQAIVFNPKNIDAKANLAALYIETGKVQQGKCNLICV